ncbi:hypothetical protein HPB48_012969 [Haemaphysalis longicornis]|uniref:Chitin-binding type-2 domain-containing protein n=1 Tax=Haemaphysalis longicornis TaxID=44386 RepID=A0A9J6FRT3_HAELO|nr:hypothetical protein HPB48_012969 [Haemaphysalis longicornis]
MQHKVTCQKLRLSLVNIVQNPSQQLRHLVEHQGTPDFTPQHGVERVPEEPAYAGDGHHPTTQPKLPPEIGQRVTAGSTQEGGPDEVPESLPEYPQTVSVRHHPQFKPTAAPETGPRVTSEFASEHDVEGGLPETSPELGDKSNAKTPAPAINSQVAKDFAPYYGTEKVLESTSEAPPNTEASLRPGYQSTIAPGETPEVTEDVAPENVRIAAPERQPKITADVYPESPLQPDARFAPKNSQENTVGFAPKNAPRYVPEIVPEPTDVGQKSGPQTVSQNVPVNQPSPTSGPTSYISPEYRESPRRETTPVYTDRITTKTRPLDAQRVKPQTPPTIPPDSIYVTVPVTPIPTVRTTTRAASRRTTSTYSRSGGWDATRAPSWAATRGSARATSPPPARATTATLSPRATPPASRGGGRSRTRSTTQAPETFNAISFMTYAPTRRDRLSTVTPTTPRDDLAPPTRDDVTLLPFPQRHLEATRASRFKCPKGRSGFFADFRSGCRRYHICFKNSSQVHECPGALLFNPISQTCDLPDKVTCVPPRRRACPNCKTTSSSTGRRRNHAHGVPSGFHFECGDLPDGFYPDVARRCHVFYRCHNGHKFPHYCKRGLLFNSKTGNCDFEGSVECSAGRANSDLRTSQPEGLAAGICTASQRPASTEGAHTWCLGSDVPTPGYACSVTEGVEKVGLKMLQRVCQGLWNVVV